MLISREVIKHYIFELIERSARFYVHLDEIKSQFYVESDSVVTDKLYFLKSYEEVLNKIVFSTSKFFDLLESRELLDDEMEGIFVSCMQSYEDLGNLHEKWLFHLPRPSEPIELRRFCRVIKKQVLMMKNKVAEGTEQDISIYISENVGDVTYATDPLHDFKSNHFESHMKSAFDLITLIDKNFDAPLLEIPEIGKSTIHIAIPRVDAANPCHWPILMHEVGHHIIGQVFHDPEMDIREDFLLYIRSGDHENEILTSFDDNEHHKRLTSWLTECWCDLFACTSMGYSYWFAQYSAFLNAPVYNTSDNYYPPPIFRLLLIKVVLSHRFSRAVVDNWEKEHNLCEEAIETILKTKHFDFWSERDLTKLLTYFQQYFIHHFLKEWDDNEIQISGRKLNSALAEIIRYTKSINKKTIDILVSSLKDGLPIPSIPIQIDETYQEKTASIQEILCAASIARNSCYKDDLLSSLTEIAGSNLGSVREIFRKSVEKKVKRFDLAILRSIQVSEWFALFFRKEPFRFDIVPLSSKEKGSGVLVDYQIADHIRAGKIKIIPIFDLASQLGSTSFDIRLGTSFQLFSPNEYGIIDFVEENNSKSAMSPSIRKNLDFIDFLVLMPGQFVLGHSMEYLKLDNRIAAELEGRSSFARLGIEIHMTAGFVDPGFEGVLTFEIFNAGHSPVKLYPGMRIGQLRFIEISEPAKSYSQRHKAKYKGLLEHHNSLQGNDYEIELLREEIIKTR